MQIVRIVALGRYGDDCGIDGRGDVACQRYERRSAEWHSPLRVGSFSRSASLLRSSPARHPRDLEILNKRGVCNLKTDQPEKALADFDRVNQHGAIYTRVFGLYGIYNPNSTWLPTPVGNPVFPESWGNRGIALLMLGRDEEAVQSFLTSINLWRSFGLLDTKPAITSISKGLGTLIIAHPKVFTL